MFGVYGEVYSRLYPRGSHFDLFQKVRLRSESEFSVGWSDPRGSHFDSFQKIRLCSESEFSVGRDPHPHGSQSCHSVKNKVTFGD